ncbi:MAG: nicotinate-nucleotide adenylyltransferase [Oscillatoriales cyanobacterium SM2_2_1]|nr:nicotinate-nucleotide adenylyltransferase [Oscillatoriales cyanobacterium SM2_2_1]
MNPHPPQIALFGTSADPPSIGHRSILEWLSQHYDRCIVWVANNPFKQHQATLGQREAMMQLVIRDIPANNIELHPELAHSRSLITVERARSRWPHANFTLAIGADLVPQLPSWYQSAQLLQQVTLLIMPRHGAPLLPQHFERLQALCAHWAIAPIGEDIPPVSSTDYRIRGKHSVIIPTVAEYIHRERLYAWDPVSHSTP